MKALDDILKVLFVLLLKRIHFLAFFVCLIWTERFKGVKGVKESKILKMTCMLLSNETPQESYLLQQLGETG